MSEFDSKARTWDQDKMHMERSIAIASELQNMIPLNTYMKALEYGAGTGILSFLLKDQFAEITLMDSSAEMIKVCEEKVESYNTRHIKPLWFDLEHTDYSGSFDIIYNQMVLHHVDDIDTMLKKFYSLLNLNGYLAIADLYPEDGSFHGPGAKVHKGFDVEVLSKKLRIIGFKEIKYKQCYIMKKQTDSGIKNFSIFLITAMK